MATSVKEVGIHLLAILCDEIGRAKEKKKESGALAAALQMRMDNASTALMMKEPPASCTFPLAQIGVFHALVIAARPFSDRDPGDWFGASRRRRR
jgi:hypothetical protein